MEVVGERKLKISTDRGFSLGTSIIDIDIVPFEGIINMMIREFPFPIFFFILKVFALFLVKPFD